MTQETKECEAPATPDPRRWLALIVVLVAGFMDLLDATIVNVAVPRIQSDLHAEYSQIEWIIAAYVLAFAAVLITGGRLGDIFGRKRLFLVGMAGFTIASALCGAAGSPEWLIWARFFQGAMAGLMVPQILAIIHVTFPRSERGKVFGMFGGVVGSASVAGPVVGGVLVEANILELQWRPIFLVNIPVGVLAMAAAMVVIKETKSPAAPRLDLLGMFLAVSAVLLLVYPLTEGRRLDWPIWTFAMMAGSVAVFALFVAYERWRTKTIGSPLVVLSLFRARSFTSGMGVWLIFMIALGGFFLVWTLYMQIGLGWTPLHAGMTAVAFALGAAPVAGISVQVLTPRFGRKVLMTGALLTAAGFGGYIWAVTTYGPDITSWNMVPLLLVTGVGFGLVVAPMIDLILTDVPIRDAGSASGLLNTTQQLGMALGVALAGVIFFTQIDTGSGHGVDEVTPAISEELSEAGIPPSEQEAVLAGFRACVQDRSAASDPTVIPESCQMMPQLGQDASEAGPIANLLTEAGEEANAHNFTRSFAIALWFGVGMMTLVFLGMFGLPSKVRMRDLEAEFNASGVEPIEPDAPEEAELTGAITRWEET